jgi:hypothetical protein
MFLDEPRFLCSETEIQETSKALGLCVCFAGVSKRLKAVHYQLTSPTVFRYISRKCLGVIFASGGLSEEVFAFTTYLKPISKLVLPL